MKKPLLFILLLCFSVCVSAQQGSSCDDPLQILGDDTLTAGFDDTWYTYECTESGMYHITTCNLNTCDTKIWVYTTCPAEVVEGPPGTYAYNDDSDCGLRADIEVLLDSGTTYLVRIGDYNNNCPDDVVFSFTELGPVIGCMDETACNYNPLATEDAPCVYFPSENCNAPDLVMNVQTLLNNMYVMQTQSTECNIEEGIVTGDGLRTVITFTVRIDNIGDIDYYIGDPNNNPQMFDTENCHGHTHYAGYGDYRLMDMQGNIIPAGHKNGFCVMDLCGFGQYNCGQMGISAGCYDQYGAGTSGQWFDVTDVPDGTYRGLVTVNPLHLPDALGHNEDNYENNTYVFCFDLFTTPEGERDFTLLGDCPAFYDCNGVENGTAQPDCMGVCDGPSIWGDLDSDEELTGSDLTQYMSILASEEIDVTTCNDLSGNGSLTVYDLSLANTCMGESSVGGTAACDFPQNVLSTTNAVGMAITAINFDEQYIDVELKSTVHDIVAYQFNVTGLIISSVTNLAADAGFECSNGFNPYTNSVYGLGEYGQMLAGNVAAQALCRIYYSQIIDNTICLEGITDIVNTHRARVANYIYGNCLDATGFGVGENLLPGNILVIPNPVNDMVQLKLSGFNTQPSTLIVRDDTGREVLSIRIPSGSQVINADFSELSSGVYTIDTNSGRVKRFVKL